MTLLKSQIFHATKVTDFNSHSRNGNEKDHDHDLKNTEQTALNGGLSEDLGSTYEQDLPCNKRHDLISDLVMTMKETWSQFLKTPSKPL